MDTKYIAYYRVSTKGQGQSGLELEAQKAAVFAYTKCSDCIVAEYTDIESGGKDDRPELLKAIQRAKAENAVLVIAKLDRLSRNLTFISNLMDNKVKFVCCDMPEANEFTIHIFAALAQQERKMISKRTKDALEAKKRQGIKLGKPENLTAEARLNSLKVRQANARNDKANRQATELILMYREKGLSYQQVAEKLNTSGYRTKKAKALRK